MSCAIVFDRLLGAGIAGSSSASGSTAAATGTGSALALADHAATAPALFQRKGRRRRHAAVVIAFGHTVIDEIANVDIDQKVFEPIGDRVSMKEKRIPHSR